MSDRGGESVSEAVENDTARLAVPVHETILSSPPYLNIRVDDVVWNAKI